MRCADKASSSLFRECFSAFLHPAEAVSSPLLAYDVSAVSHASGWLLSCGETMIKCRDVYDLIYEFEKDMTERLQLLRADLFFVHGAALSVADRCVIISGQSGSGKSSLAWCLSHNGFEYLSDELAPINQSALNVELYPHALCLKSGPLSEPPFPDSTQYTAASNHVPAYELSTRALGQPCPLDFLVFIDNIFDGRGLVVRGIGAAESAARLYSKGLNQLSHRGDGLTVIAEISSIVPSYFMSGGAVENRALAIRNLYDSTAVNRIDLQLHPRSAQNRLQPYDT